VLDDVVRWFHLLAAAVWIGGSITVGALVPALRSAGATREQLRAAARRFGTVAWIALATSVVTGVVQVVRLHYPMRGRLEIKIGLVVLAALAAYIHQVTAARSRPVIRAGLETLSLGLALAILAVAVSL
jgi:putative copper export protein